MADPVDMTSWQGRIDPEADSLRWHQCVEPWTGQTDPGIALLGLASDAGVARNKGRPGARRGPQAIRTALANMAWHADDQQRIYDAGDIVCGDDTNGHAMEQAQYDLGQRAAALMRAGQRPILLGGGHEIAFASWQGIATHLASSETQPRIGIVNLDAHFDLRDPAEIRSSGTPFNQIAADCEARGWPFRYACLGVARASNTAALYRRAHELGVLVHEDRDLERGPDTVADDLQAFIADCDYLYLTIDLDGLPSSEAPGVSAPAARGVSLARFEPLIDAVRDSGKLCAADIAELNPDYDIDKRTARVAARLVHQLACHT
ncbi:formimidoylglutamase [Salinisphaera sp. USBA-960]|uniref:formimidoylglutamase n=1 Tax=Salinisphaera orenii TaxID=856731 RepID=UPI000DBE9E24|nr:formimidoylglutamase [Salifodinibacter halophilus]NNC25734.1 formimidoylglutamase [Salifodinibacter halophilus]